MSLPIRTHSLHDGWIMLVCLVQFSIKKQSIKTNFMKKNQPLRLKKIAKLAIVFTFFSPAVFAQVGENDSTFNVPDNGSGATYKGSDYSIRLSALQNDHSKIVLAGEFTNYNSQANKSIVRIFTNGSIDNSFSPGTGFNVAPAALAIQADNRILVGGNFTNYNGTIANRIVRLQEDGSIDNSFLTGTGFNAGVKCLEIQSDGKIIVLGGFNSYKGAPVKNIVRLNSDGIKDSTFHPYDTVYSDARRFTLQPNGQLIIAFQHIEQLELIRLNTNGSLDPSFHAILPLSSFYIPSIECLTVQQDGKVLIGGHNSTGNSPELVFFKRVDTNGIRDTTFTLPFPEGSAGSINSISMQSDGKIIIAGHKDKGQDEHTSAQFIARLNTSGDFDESFVHNNKFYAGMNIVYSTCLLPHGKVLAAGLFPEINTYTAHNIALLNSDGTMDPSFNGTTGVNGIIKASSIQEDQKILIGGLFSGVHAQPRSHIARLFADGTLDTSFNPGRGTNGRVYAITTQADGKIIIGGEFSTYNDLPANNLVRVNADGSIDPTYNIGTGVTGIVYTLSVQNNNKLIVGGNFIGINGVYRSDVARVNADGSVDTTFAGEVTASESGLVYTSLILPNGKIMIGGNFTARHNLVDRKHLVRLNTDGTVDSTFQQVRYFDYRDLSLQPDGKIIACGGRVGSLYLSSSGFIDRYNENGTYDTTWRKTFEPGIKPLYSITLLSTGKTIVGGEFIWFYGQENKYITMVDSAGNMDSSFVGHMDGPVYTTQAVANNKAIIGGVFNNYTGHVRNNIARIIGEPDVINAIKQHAFASPFVVYPNPASGFINADHLKPGSMIIIRNVMGAVVYREQINTNRAVINVSDYSNGIYFITQQNKEQQNTMRFIINK